MPPWILAQTNSFTLTYFPSKTNNSLWCFSAISERNTTLTMRCFSLMLAAISQLRSHEPRSDFKSLLMEIGMLSNVYFEK